MNRHVVTAALIGSVAIIIAAWIVSAGMTSLGRSIERAAPRSAAHVSVPSIPHEFTIRLAPAGGESAFKLILDNQQSQPFKVDVQDKK